MVTFSDAQSKADSGGKPGRRVTVVGLGALGLPMALRLKLGGYDVTGVDPGSAEQARAAAHGIPCVADIKDTRARTVSVIVVATGSQLLDVARSAIAQCDDLAREAWVIVSTVGPRDARCAAAMLQAHGVVVIDAPVTGGVPGAEAGQLRFFAAGPEDAVAEQSPLLRNLGQVLHVGDCVGDGQAMKLVNQLCSSTHLVVTAEAVSFAVALGLDATRAVAAISGGSGASWQFDDRGPRMATATIEADAQAEVHTRLAILAKDSALVAAEADSVGAFVPMLRAARDQYVEAAQRGLLEQDDSQIVRTYLDSTAQLPAAVQRQGACT
jgi:3-hydroxyisobutyrate dehydrogenase